LATQEKAYVSWPGYHKVLINQKTTFQKLVFSTFYGTDKNDTGFCFTGKISLARISMNVNRPFTRQPQCPCQGAPPALKFKGHIRTKDVHQLCGFFGISKEVAKAAKKGVSNQALTLERASEQLQAFIQKVQRKGLHIPEETMTDLEAFVQKADEQINFHKVE